MKAKLDITKLVLASGIIMMLIGITTYLWAHRKTDQPLDLTNLWRIPQNNKKIKNKPDGTKLYNYNTTRPPIPIAP